MLLVTRNSKTKLYFQKVLMKKLSLLLLYFFLQCSTLFAFNLEEGLWTDFSGTLGKTNFYLSLYRGTGDSVTGSYYTDGATRKIWVEGIFSYDVLFLKEKQTNKKLAIFKGKVYSTDQDDFIKGFRMERNGGQAQRFEMHVTAKVGGTAQKRYSDVSLTDEQVERFALDVKQAFLSDKKEWLAEQIAYPLTVRLNNGKKLDLQQAKDFIQNYSNIINADFKKRLRVAGCFNLFHNYQGIMMGNGEIWLTSDTENKKMLVMGMNN